MQLTSWFVYFLFCSQIQIVKSCTSCVLSNLFTDLHYCPSALLYVNLSYTLSTVSACKENVENTRWTPWGMGEILKLSPMVSANQIVTGAADRLPDIGGK